MSYPNPYSGYNYQFQSYQQPTDSYQQPNYPQPTYDQTQYNYQYQQPYQQQQQPQQQYEQQQSYSSEYNPNQYSTQSSYTSPTAPKYTPPPQSPYEQPSVYSYAYPKTQTRWLQNYNSQADAYKGNLKQVFDDIDKNRSGHLDFAELTTAMQTLGEDASPSTIELMIQMFDKNQSGSIDFTEFGELYAYIQEMRTAFNGADQEHSRSLGIEQVQAAMSRIHGPWLVVGGGVLLFTLFKLFDKNKQGKLDWHHFLEMGLKFAGLRSRFEHNPYGITGGKHSLNAQAPSSTASQTGFNAGIPPFSAGSNQGPIFGQSQQQPFAQQPQQNFNQPPQQSYGQQQNRPPQPPFNQQFNQPNQQPSGQGYPAYPSSGAPTLEIPPFNPGKMDTFGQFAQFAQNLLNRDLPIDISSFQS